MTKEDYAAWKDINNLTHDGAAVFLGVCRRTSLNYQAGKTGIPMPVARVIGLSERYKALGLPVN